MKASLGCQSVKPMKIKMQFEHHSTTFSDLFQDPRNYKLCCKFGRHKPVFEAGGNTELEWLDLLYEC
jgi:hypothetical protein